MPACSPRESHRGPTTDCIRAPGLGPFDELRIDREYLVHDGVEGVEGGLNGVAPVNGNLSMENLLEHFRVGDQAIAMGDRSLQHAQRDHPMGMVGADEIHGTLASTRLMLRDGPRNRARSPRSSDRYLQSETRDARRYG